VQHRITGVPLTLNSYTTQLTRTIYAMLD